MVKQSIIPAIIPASYTHLSDRLREVRDAVRTVQVDVFDGTFTDTTSWPYAGTDKAMFESKVREDDGLPYWQELDLEVDLMVRDPEEHIERWALAGATRIIVHVESTPDPARVVAQCIERRLEVALALKPDTPEDVLEPLLPRVVFVQCMGNGRIGRHGVALDPGVYDKIARMHTRWPAVLIGVDIGVNKDTIPRLYESGARRFAAGSAVFGMGDALRAFRELDAVVRTCERAHQ
jgi:ribulose-phosphate 3-epimerase